jgi:rhodanese-related sulfurtransferase
LLKGAGSIQKACGSGSQEILFLRTGGKRLFATCSLSSNSEAKIRYFLVRKRPFTILRNHEKEKKMSTVQISTPHSTHEVREGKVTDLGLYVTAREAYEMWQAGPERIKVIDVRTFEEYVLVGHAEMAANIPLAFPTYTWDASKGNYSVVMNSDFIEHVSRRFNLNDTILVMCRSGDRSARAANALAKAGFKKVHNIIDGFEGDKVDDPESVHCGKRMRNGWKNSAPWTYDLNPALAWLPSDEELETLRHTLDL